MKPVHSSQPYRNQRGIALIAVVSIVAVMTILTVAMLHLSQNERRSAVKYSDGEMAKNLADSAVNIVMGQISEATFRNSEDWGLWASQPGAIRAYNANGSFKAGYKLYSDDQLIVESPSGDGTAAERAFTGDIPDMQWASKPAVWQDMNEPVIRPDRDGDGNPEVIYPIVDPRAFIRQDFNSQTGKSQDESPNIEGFSYNASFPGVVDAESLTDINARLPMPVRWMYVLKDGNIGHLDDSNAQGPYKFIGANGDVAPTDQNPIVGRIAFWTDDETSKININTASEPTYWSPPFAYHAREYEWAIYQPARFEYQRYPGHPATVAMSTVLFPNRDFDIRGKSTTERDQIMKLKERLYQVMPKINLGGSIGGTVPFWVGSDPEYSGNEKLRVEIYKATNQPLYASVDELLFSNQVQDGRRLTQDEVPNTVPLFDEVGGADPVGAERALERTRFFLTAHSRSPELNLFGQPRVAMWPIANETAGGMIKGDPKEYRTVFDNLIAYCSSLGGTAESGNSYVFRRAHHMSPNYDFQNIPRNRQLLEYLYETMSRPFPSGNQGSVSFADKWNDEEVAQVVTLIFDYIRSTNLYDGILAPKREELLSRSGPYWMTGTVAERMTRRDNLRNTKTRTFTADRGSGIVSFTYTGADGNSAAQSEDVSYSAFPGHGQVTPIKTTIKGHESQGLGRFVTVSEVGFHFIATADGSTDSGSWPYYTDKAGAIDMAYPRHGGRTSTKLQFERVVESGGSGRAKVQVIPHPVITGQKMLDRWYSNFPSYPTTLAKYNASNDPESPRYWRHHPGYNSVNWNMSLPRNAVLPPGARRLQGMLALELSTVSAGYTGLHPDMTLVVTGTRGMTMTSRPTPSMAPLTQRLFPDTDDERLYWRAPANLFQTTHNREAGSSVGPSAMTQSRNVKARGIVPKDEGYQAEYSTSSSTYEGAANFEFVTNFFNATYDPDTGSGSMRFSGGTIKIEIYSTRAATPENLVQVVEVKFPEVDMPIPELVVLGTAGTKWTNAGSMTEYTADRVEAPRWWGFNYGGVIGHFTGYYNPEDLIMVDAGVTSLRPISSGDALYKAAGVEDGRTLGRFFSRGSHHGRRFGTPRFDNQVWASTGASTQYPGRTAISGRSTLNTYGDYMRPLTLRPGKFYTGDANLDTAEADGLLSPEVESPFGQDVMVSMVPAHSDLRVLAAKAYVGPEHWELHPASNATTYMAHSFARFSTDYEDGYNVGTDNNHRLALGARHQSATRPDMAPTERVRSKQEAQKSGDFDTGQGPMRDGPWINKPDEGNTGLEMKSHAVAGATNNLVRTPTAYYDEMWRSSEAGEAFVSPNRMIPSSGMLGSLPTGVQRNRPWETLLFRAWIPQAGHPGYRHPGAPNYGTSAGNNNTAQTPFAGRNPADHYIMDLFWMPVVEPYAISESFSTAGKVNLNYQIMPFHIYLRRATAMHAVLKDEIMFAYPISNTSELHTTPSGATMLEFNNGYGNYHFRAKWSDLDSEVGSKFYSTTITPSPKRFWHRKLSLDRRQSAATNAVYVGTLGHFENKFNFNSAFPARHGGLFRTASQIAEVVLVPEKVAGVGGSHAQVEAGSAIPTDGSDQSANSPYLFSAMGAFWQPRSVTGENLKEKPYTNIYGKVTTQSNTYRVHYRAQVIRKARSTALDEFDPNIDSITSDYRGSTIIERRIDPADPRLPNYALTPKAEPMDRYYNYRVIETKRFIP